MWLVVNPRAYIYSFYLKFIVVLDKIMYRLPCRGKINDEPLVVDRLLWRCLICINIFNFCADCSSPTLKAKQWRRHKHRCEMKGTWLQLCHRRRWLIGAASRMRLEAVVLTDSAGWGAIFWDLALLPHFSIWSILWGNLYSLVTNASSAYRPAPLFFPH